MEEDGDQRTLILRVDSKYDAFIHFGADHLFAEYSREWGKFGVVSLFDRRPTLETTEAAKLATFFFLWLCRSLAKVQRVPPKFFHVVGQGPPWNMFERDITSGELYDRGTLEGESWLPKWKDLGLFGLRQQVI